MTNQRGFALLAVMLVLALLGVVVTELSVSMRLEASMVRSYKESVLASHLAEAAIQQAIREILGPGTIQALEEGGTLVFLRGLAGASLPVKLPKLPRTRVTFGAGEFSYRITDEEARINLNTAPADRVDRLLTAVGVDKQARDIINDSLQDWKDVDDLHRTNGAESEDFYLKLPVPYRARNGPLQDAAELLQIRGVTREIYAGAQGHAGLADLVTVTGGGTVNLNTAPEAVLRALGLLDAEVSDITGGRASNPKLDALVVLARDITEKRGRVSETSLNAFFAAGYDEGNLVDLVLQISDKVAMNYLHNLTNIPVDFPLARPLDAVMA